MTQYRKEERINKLKIMLESKNLVWVGREFVNAKTDIDVKCTICGNIMTKYPELIRITKYPCDTCRPALVYKDKHKKAQDIFNKRFYNSGLSNNFEIVKYPEFIREYATFRHKPCGNLINTSIGNLERTTKNMKGSSTGCEYCSNTHTYTDEEIISYINKERPNYRFVSSYMSASHHLMLKVVHKLCNTERDFQVNYFMRGEGCRFCTISGGAEDIIFELNRLNINYEAEKSFEDLKSDDLGGTLRYDFYVEDNNLLIEYDGKQHNNSIEIWGGEQALARRNKLDEAKNKYAISNDYTLIRFPDSLRGSALRKSLKNILNNDLDTINKYKVKPTVRQSTINQKLW